MKNLTCANLKYIPPVSMAENIHWMMYFLYLLSLKYTNTCIYFKLSN